MEGSLKAWACWKGLGIGVVGPGRWSLSFRSFGLGGGDSVGFVDCCPCLHCSSPSSWDPGEVLPCRRVDLQVLQGSLQSFLVASYLTPFSTNTRGMTTQSKLSRQLATFQATP
ncbi:unnamed protein product [Schistocephalus solidus]|uniref:Secreted protein n=1 Tax=Schistocephalus solidus TaxID=70667 RepID=A0A183SRX5_SCHSO|nr:unnamed protein product [Schistocephalus solidus]